MRKLKGFLKRILNWIDQSYRSKPEWIYVGNFKSSVSLGGTGEVATSLVDVRIDRISFKVQHRIIPYSDPEIFGSDWLDGWRFDYPSDVQFKLDLIKLMSKRDHLIKNILS